MTLAMPQQNFTTMEHAARTAVAATAALFIARRCAMVEAYWAPITSIVVLQSTLGATLSVSIQRLIGTVLGAAVGALWVGWFGANVVAFGAGVFVAGAICGVLRLQRNAFRYAGITLAIVMLIARTRSPWIIALHRFTEVSLGVFVGLIVTALWREHGAAPPPPKT
jgi:uncharacterized membrane protein YccC